ncbi:2'-5' RNA ligase family protein [Gorillibacterium sp. sgz500922]|uniref:2'-5' RNA ligase family protein n=1 Tax=Gorillibacterium sp. sgz500922 TaxID=3446694 RepID=UPI003F66CEFC
MKKACYPVWIRHNERNRAKVLGLGCSGIDIAKRNQAIRSYISNKEGREIKMEEPRIYLIAQFDKSTNQKLADIYDVLAQTGLIGEQTQGIPYHFTLGSFALECRDQVLERVQSVSLHSKAFDIHLNHIGLFGLKVLFIAPSMNMELLHLYKDLVPSEPISGYHHWVAHATILIDDPERMRTAIPIVAQSFSPFAARIESIGVYEFFPEKFIAEYPLVP